MRAIVVPLAVAGLLIAVLVAGCGGAPEPAPEPPSPSPTAVQTAPPEPEPTDTPPPPPPPTPTEVVLADPANCITCHTSQETLQALAEEPEEQESHSEGEG